MVVQGRHAEDTSPGELVGAHLEDHRDGFHDEDAAHDEEHDLLAHDRGDVGRADALAAGIEAITVYAFSTENWRRPVDEVRYLMGFNESLLKRRRDELHAEGIRITFSGRRDWRVPRRVLKNMEEAEELTKRNKVMTLNMAFNYGGRAEIVDAVRQLVADGVRADKIDEKAIRSRLYHPEIPDPDVVVRTSGEYRISNYLLWESAYSEFVFTDVLWPDFRTADLRAAIVEFQQRDRRFGGVEDA